MARVVLLVLTFIASSLALRRQSKRAKRASRQDGYVTLQGCKCRAGSQCKAGAGTGFKCDTCKTEGRCGTWSPTGRWDYCDYRPATRSDFVGQSWTRKMDYFWKNIVQNTTRYPEFPLLQGFLGSILPTFDNYLPEAPAGREKMIHTVGSVCQFELNVPRNSPYTGVFGAGKQRGLIRLGGALDPGNDGITPGLGLKFPRSGVPDGDFVGLYSLAAGDQWDFFARNQSNHLEPLNDFPINLLTTKFKDGSDCVYQVGLSDLARYSQDGREHNPRFPFKVMFIANRNLKTGQGEKTIDAVHQEIDAIAPGSVLYELYACGEPAGDEMKPTSDLSACGKPFKLGDIRTSSVCTTSWYGDVSLHFRHQRIEEDWELEPSFMQQGSYDVNQVCRVPQDGVPPPKCGEEGMLNDDVALADEGSDDVALADEGENETALADEGSDDVAEGGRRRRRGRPFR